MGKKKKTIIVMSGAPGGDGAATIQAALEEIPDGGVIYFPAGTYKADGSPLQGPRDWSPRTGKCDCKKHQGPVAE